MANCDYCDILEKSGRSHILYEDALAVIAIRDSVLTPGHITIFPKKHHTILEMVPESILKHCAILAKKTSSAIFESLGAEGTNIIIRNGIGAGQLVPHCGIDIVPRRETDGLNLQWEPKQLMEDDLETAQLLVKDALEKLSREQVEEKKPKPEPKKELAAQEGKENYLVKSVRRIP